MIITLDYDNDQIRIEDGQIPATFSPVNENTLNLVKRLTSEIFNRLGAADISIRRQSDGELTTIEEW